LIINTFNTSVQYLDFIKKQDQNFEINDCENLSMFERLEGLKVLNTPKYFYDFNNFKKLSTNSIIYDYTNEKSKDGFIDSLFETGITFTLNQKNQAEDVFVGGYKDFYNITDTKKIIFLDRDGVINEDVHYPSKVSDINLIPEIISIIKHFKKLNYEIVVVSNQSGIARGKLTFSDLSSIQNYLDEIFFKENILINDWIYCPYHIDGKVEKYSKSTYLRKPHPGMILNYMHSHIVSLKDSLMIGDKDSDNLNILNLKTFLIHGKYKINQDHFSNHQELMDYLKIT